MDGTKINTRDGDYTFYVVTQLKNHNYFNEWEIYSSKLNWILSNEVKFSCILNAKKVTQSK